MAITDVFSDTLFSTSNDQALGKFQEAIQHLKHNQYSEALEHFRHAIILDSRRTPDVFIFLYKRLNVNFSNMPFILGKEISTPGRPDSLVATFVSNCLN